ncbi:MAG TPA: hypothetical protein VGH19_02800 [Verrucomicrobiae bacterium]
MNHKDNSMRRHVIMFAPAFLLLMTGCSSLSLPRDPVTNRVYQKQHYDYYDNDYERERALASGTNDYDNSASIDDTFDRLRNEKPKHDSYGWKYQPPAGRQKP